MLRSMMGREFSSLKTRFMELLPENKARIARVKKEKGELLLGSISVEQALGGMRGVKGLLTETSKLDAQHGIRFRGLTILECQERLPHKLTEPLPEGMLYLLLTGEVPTAAQVEDIRRDLVSRSALPRLTENLLFTLPTTMHPMTQLSIGVLSLQAESEFLRQYNQGMNKVDYWKPTFEDAMNLIARIPKIAAIIYRKTYKDGRVEEIDEKKDWAANFAKMMGYHEEGFEELMRLYLTIHSDHEGGNVSAHTTHLVGSALSDPYLSYSAGLNGLAGPLHGLANQEHLKFLLSLKAEVGDDPSEADVETYVKKLLKSGQVVPGYGHAVLRVTDPRFTCQLKFAERHMPNDPLCKLVKTCYSVVPKVLAATGKVKNPWPNVDAHSGALLYYYGLREFDFYTVLFGVSRAIGCMANLVWSRGLGLPLERPDSVTLEWLEALASSSK